jgi:Trypsin
MTVLTLRTNSGPNGIGRVRAAAIAALALGVAVAALVTVRSPATEAAGHAAAGALGPQAETSDYMENVASAVQARAQSKFASIFGAIEVTGRGSHVIVFLTSLSRVAEAQLSSLGRPGTVSFARTSHSEAQLLAVHAEVTKDVNTLTGRGIDIVSWFPGINGDGLEHIGVIGLTPAKAHVLDRLFGASRVVLQGLSESQAPQALANRVDDNAPWNGGDNLTGSNGTLHSGCTSGVGITYQGAQYMITAAHCYEPGWQIYNEFVDVSRPDNFMGTEVSRDVRSGGDDTALVRMPVSGNIWTGIIGQPVPKPVAGDATNTNGFTVYNEGAYSGEVAARVQNNYAGCIYLSGYTGLSSSRKECNLVQATSSGIASQEGDSGGPVIRYIGGRLMVTGIVSASGGPAITCQYNIQYEHSKNPAQSCYHTFYYTAMTEILSTEYPGAQLVG